MMAENVIETNKSNDIDVDKIQARNVQTFAQKLKQYKNHPTSLILYLLVSVSYTHLTLPTKA